MFLSIFVFHYFLHADYLNRDKPKDIKMSEAKEWVIGKTWSEATKKEFFGSSTDTPTYKIVWDWVNYSSPLKYWKEFTVRVVSDVTRLEAREIADLCKAKYKKPWDVISCVSVSVSETAVQTCDADCCARVTLAFKDAINWLNWKNLSADYKGASYGDGTLHVINKLNVWLHGVKYTYVVDALNGPETIFPYSDTASEFHDKDQDGKIDQLNLVEVL